VFGAGSRSGIPVLPFRLREKASFSLAEFSLGQVKAKPLIDLGFRTRNANRSPEAGLCLAVPVCLGDEEVSAVSLINKNAGPFAHSTRRALLGLRSG
jgi:hypothetical protein